MCLLERRHIFLHEFIMFELESLTSLFFFLDVCCQLSFFTFRETIGNLDRSKLQLLALSSAGIGAVLCYLAWKQSPKTIPIGDGWWGAGEKPLTEDETIHKFVVKTSVEEIEVGVQQ